MTAQTPKRRGPQPGSQILPVYNSMAVCQAATGIPIAALAAAKAAGCPGFRFNRIYLAELLPAMMRCREALTAALDALAPANNADASGAFGQNTQLPLIPDASNMSPRKELEMWKAGREKIKFLRERELIVLRTSVEQDVKEALAMHIQMLERIFCSELPPKLVGLRELAIRDKNRAAVEEMITELRSKLEAITATTETTADAVNAELSAVTNAVSVEQTAEKV